MSGFESWIANAPAALVVLVACALLGGAGIGAWWGLRRGWDHAYENMRWERAHRGSRGGTVMPYRPPEIAHEWPQDVGEATDLRVQAGAATDPQRSTDRSLRVGNPLALAHPALTRGDPITTGEIAAITPRMEKFLEELFAVPYSADELWSGQ